MPPGRPSGSIESSASLLDSAAPRADCPLNRPAVTFVHVDSLLERLIGESQTTGWAVGSLPTYGFAGSHRVQASTLTWDAKQLGLTPIANREGDDPHSTLRPTAPEDARPASLSAVVGLNAQPLHTDGAHLARVPEYVLLWSAEPNSTPTRVWSPWDAIQVDEQHGMFVVRSGRRTWLAPAIESYRKLR